MRFAVTSALSARSISAPRTRAACGRARFRVVTAVLLVIGCCAAAPFSPKTMLVGANVDAGVLLPGEPNFVDTSEGDLFDIAQKAGLNAFRVTEYETWASDQRDTPYTAAQWQTLASRALATHIALVPLLELSLPDRRAIANVTDATARIHEYVTREEAMADLILGKAGLAKSGVVAALDLGNEPELSATTLTVARTVSTYVHERYPTIPVTIGGWKVPLSSSSASHWLWNGAADGAPLLPYEDVVEPHVYDVALPGAVLPGGGFRSLDDEPAASVTLDVERYVQAARVWSADEPLLVGEFGMPNGLGARSHLATSTIANPDEQSAHIAAVFAGLRAARAHGALIAGALLWTLAPRGGPGRLQTEDNAWSVIVPQGPGKALRILPGLVSLCQGFGATCAGARELLNAPPVQR